MAKLQATVKSTVTLSRTSLLARSVVSCGGKSTIYTKRIPIRSR